MTALEDIKANMKHFWVQCLVYWHRIHGHEASPDWSSHVTSRRPLPSFLPNSINGLRRAFFTGHFHLISKTCYYCDRHCWLQTRDFQVFSASIRLGFLDIIWLWMGRGWSQEARKDVANQIRHYYYLAQGRRMEVWKWLHSRYNLMVEPTGITVALRMVYEGRRNQWPWGFGFST